jgi:hypothetical protein
MAPGFLRRQLAIPDREVTFEARGFQPAPEEKRLRLEHIGRTFVEGYHSALDHRDAELEQRLARVEPEDRGFAFEGAAMAIAIEDTMLPFRGRFESWLAGPGWPHEYMTYVGAGWAVARIPWQRFRAERRARALHRFLWPLVLDGFGFHEAYFHSTDLAGVSNPRGLDTDLGRSAYDQGLGRGFWFVCGADPWNIAALIGQYDSFRRWDLWSGAGLACAYAGGVSREEARIFARVAGPFAAAAGQGACFAAKARIRAGNLAAHTEMACQMLCGMSAVEAAALCDRTYLLVRDAGGTYHDWRKLVRSKLEGVSTPKVRKPICQLP